jgi:PIN domain nuclease of toxin-antitoxin system
MRLLLDTHIWLWSHLEPAYLGKRVSSALEDKRNELWLSPLSLWETLRLAEKGRVWLTPSAEEWIAVALRRMPTREAFLTSDVALATQQIQLPHRDPVDQFLAATARVFDLTLVTADARLLQGKGFASLPNR